MTEETLVAMAEEGKKKVSEGEDPGTDFLVRKLVDMEARIGTLESLVKSLGDATGAQLKRRQVAGGWQLYWEKAGRIIIP